MFSSYAWTAAYGNGIWVAVGAGGNSIATSPDGFTWTGRTGTSIFSGNGQGVAYGKDPIGNNLWVAVGNGTNNIATSPDGITWTGKGGSNMFTYAGYGVAYSSSQKLWVAVGTGINSIAYSTDGITWTGKGAVFSTAGFLAAVNS